MQLQELSNYTNPVEEYIAKLVANPKMYAAHPRELAAYLGISVAEAAALQLDADFFQKLTHALTRSVLNPGRLVQALDKIMREVEEGRGRLGERVAALKFLAQQTDTLRPVVARQETEQTFRVVLTYAAPADTARTVALGGGRAPDENPALGAPSTWAPPEYARRGDSAGAAADRVEDEEATALPEEGT